jgi:hypothetical protein
MIESPHLDLRAWNLAFFISQQMLIHFQSNECFLKISLEYDNSAMRRVAGGGGYCTTRRMLSNDGVESPKSSAYGSTESRYAWYKA